MRAGDGCWKFGRHSPPASVVVGRRNTARFCGMNAIRVVDYDQLEESDDEVSSSPSRPDYHRWATLHSAVTEVLSRFGTVGSTESVDFYHSGDWFDERADAFSLMPGAELSVPCLRELQEAVIGHDTSTTLILEADTDSPL